MPLQNGSYMMNPNQKSPVAPAADPSSQPDGAAPSGGTPVQITANMDPASGNWQCQTTMDDGSVSDGEHASLGELGDYIKQQGGQGMEPDADDSAGSGMSDAAPAPSMGGSY